MLLVELTFKCTEITGRIQIDMPTRCMAKVADFMTINRISIGRMTLTFSFHFNFNINELANTCIW